MAEERSPSRPVMPSRGAWLTVALAAVLLAGGLSLGNWQRVHKPQATTAATLVGGPDAGQRNAPVVLEIYEDYQCPYCAQASREIVPPLVQKYVDSGKVRLLIHDLAFLGPESLIAARGATCATRQGQYWPFRDRLYGEQHGENKGWLTEDLMRRYALDLGLKADAFQACMADPTVAAGLVQATKAARDNGVQGTPWFVVNGHPAGSVASFKDLDRLLLNLAALQK